MILKRSVKRIVLSIFALCLLLLVYIMPEANNDIKVNTIIEYVNSELKTHQIFMLDDNNYISQTEIVIKSEDKKELAKELIEYLIVGGKYQDKIPSGFKALINENTKINNVELLDSTIKIDFNESLLDTNKDFEEKTIEAIVYTLTSIDGIDNVIIYINGNILTYLPNSKTTLPTTLNRSFGINKEYNINSNKNITKTTIYYISEFNDNIYYTPITKVSNNDKEKIEIIIEELSDNSSSNLDSYLNYNTKLVANELNENSITVDFNEYILSDLDQEKISEEVLNTICMSIYDNYDIEEIVFKVNGEEILKNTLKSIE